MEMDKNVIPLVEYFNSHGLQTHMSCEGHNKTNMSMFWISFDESVSEVDIVSFQMKHLQRGCRFFSSCGRFAERLYVGPKIVKQWCYFAATIDAAFADLRSWQNDDLNSNSILCTR